MSIESILTVVAEAASHDLVSLQEARDELGNPSIEKNVLIKRDVRSASKQIENYCARVFVAETVTELFRSRGPLHAFQGTGHPIGFPSDGAVAPGSGGRLMLRRYPIISVVTITEDGADLVEGTDFEVDAEPGMIRRLWNDTVVRWSFEKLSVTYQGGYTAAAMPEDLQEAALLLITSRYRSRGRDPALRQRNVPGVLEETYWVGAIGEDGALPPRVQDLLDQFREVRV